MTWLEKYRTNKDAVWIKAKLTNGEDIYLDSFKEFIKLSTKLENSRVFFEKLSLQFRSHEVQLDITDCDGVYLVRSVLGQFGAATKDTVTFGKIIGNDVYKTVFLSPELIVEKEYKDLLSNCFEEAVVYNHAKKKI
jgi:hypothetical protein